MFDAFDVYFLVLALLGLFVIGSRGTASHGDAILMPIVCGVCIVTSNTWRFARDLLLMMIGAFMFFALPLIFFVNWLQARRT